MSKVFANVICRLSAIWFCLLGFGVFQPSFASQKRVALVIGNSDYQHTQPLSNPGNDAQDMATVLRRLGFEVHFGKDLTFLAMNQLLKRFSRALNGADVGLFFYAGHGMQVNGQNYIIPIDAELKQQSDLQFETIGLNNILAQLLRTSLIRLVFLDACRDNSFGNNLARSKGPGSRRGGGGQGLAVVNISGASGTLVTFATSPGQVALDGFGRNSPFTGALLKHIEIPNVDIDLMMKRVRGEVSRSTRQRQQPWTNSSLNGEFFIATKTSISRPGSPAAKTFPATKPSNKERCRGLRLDCSP